MIFTAHHARLVMRGEKTMTRRRVRAGEEHCRYRPGGSYAVQPGRTERAIGRLVVTHAERQLLGEITEADARREGCRGRAPLTAFARVWLAISDRQWAGVLDQVSDEEALERFRTKFGGQEVWVISFVRDPTSAPRMLHRHSERGYTTSPRDALAEEPEAVDEWTQHVITREANQRDEERRDMAKEQARRRLDSDLRDITLRMAAARLRAQRSGLDVKNEMRLAELSIRKVGTAAATALGSGD